jgi:hypothetical protein
MGYVQLVYMGKFRIQKGVPGIPGMICVCHGRKRGECVFVLNGRMVTGGENGSEKRNLLFRGG